MASERFIENNVIRNRAMLGYPDSLFIRRCRAGRGFGVVDVLLLPVSGPHRVVLIEAKQKTSIDAQAKVMGQVLMYYAGLSHLGARGLRYLRDFARLRPEKARSVAPKLLKGLTGGITPPDAAWLAMQGGRRIEPSRIALFVALDGHPSLALKTSLFTLARHHGLSIGVVSVLGRDKLEVWRAT